jgi:hypothetical protein
MKITKFHEYIKETLNDTAEDYVEQALRDILDKINDMFPEDENEDSEDELISFAQARKKGDEKAAAAKKINFKDYGAELIDANISRQAATLTVTIEEAEAWYKIYFMIDIKQAVPTGTEDFDFEKIKDCRVKFVRYNNGDKIDKKISETVPLKEIDEDMLIELKLKVDGDKTEGLGIETE